MHVADMLLFYDYNYWATGRILDAATGITEVQFSAPARFPYGGLRGTLTHVLGAEVNWRARWQGSAPLHRPQEAEFPTVAALTAAWRADEASMRAFLANLTDDDLLRPLRYTRSSGQAHTSVLWHHMVHVVNHGTQHRAEAAALLTDLGHSPGDLDLSMFLIERGL